MTSPMTVMVPPWADAQKPQDRGQDPLEQVGDPEPAKNAHQADQGQDDPEDHDQVSGLAQGPAGQGGVGRTGREHGLGRLREHPGGRKDPVHEHAAHKRPAHAQKGLPQKPTPHFWVMRPSTGCCGR
jgi:hypothetical protein